MSRLEISLGDSRETRNIKKAYYIISEDELSCTDYIKELRDKFPSKIIEILSIGHTAMCKVERLEQIFQAYIAENNKEVFDEDDKCYILDFDIITSEGHKNNVIEYIGKDFIIYYNNPMFEYWVALHLDPERFVSINSMSKEEIDEFCQSKELMYRKALTEKGLVLLIQNYEAICQLSKEHVDLFGKHKILNSEITS